MTVWHDFDSVEAARSFASSDALRDAIGRSGVTNEPQIWYVTES